MTLLPTCSRMYHITSQAPALQSTTGIVAIMVTSLFKLLSNNLVTYQQLKLSIELDSIKPKNS